ncbi:hypothetical protein ADU59_28430 [Pararhizobium polonicum]|uniref:D-serine dehydratase-like domain-containing protein n=1 Tax=Pararhizobium polonicum TaxID=1612624 RepID=A0A1C7NT17_9HYPH|nr:hypothetical protein ADU59_28430 [Pararhizobium polonicum]
MIDLPTPQDLVLDSTTRGVPPGISLHDSAITSEHWSPLDGSMTLPVMTLDQSVLLANTNHFLAFAKDEGVFLAPHAKTPMMPQFAASLVARGAWGATVANVQQLSAMQEQTISDIIYASPPGGRIGASHLAAAIGRRPASKVFVFLDSVETVDALHQALARVDGACAYGLVEVGFGRTGARNLAASIAIRDAILSTKGLIALAGVATYEAAAVVKDVDHRKTFDRLFKLVEETFLSVHDAVSNDTPLIISAGGSTYFDDVIRALRPLSKKYDVPLVLRSGAIFFSDDGLYSRAFEAMAKRGFAAPIARAIRPALSLWAEIISRPEPGLAIAGFGMRDAPNDQGLPVIRRVFRNGSDIGIGGEQLPVVDKLNDQHAFIGSGAVDDVRVGDVLELGISHPCTAFQRWNAVYATDERHVVQAVLRTHFG